MNGRLPILLAIVVTVGSCQADAGVRAAPDPVLPGELALSVTGPHGDDGGVWVRITGPLDGVEARPAGTLEAVADRRGDTLDLVVVGETLSGVVAVLSMADVAGADDFALEVIEVSDRTNRVRESLDGYRIELKPLTR